MSLKRSLEPALEVAISSGETLTCRANESAFLEDTPPGSHLKVCKQLSTPEVKTPTSRHRSNVRRSKKARRNIFGGLGNDNNETILIENSGSDGDSEDDDGEAADIRSERTMARELREEEIMFAERCHVDLRSEAKGEVDVGLKGEFEGKVDGSKIGVVEIEVDGRLGGKVEEEVEGSMRGVMKGEMDVGLKCEFEGEVNGIMRGVMEGETEGEMGGPDKDLASFTWTDDFSCFTGRADTYSRSPGPSVKLTQDPVEIFLHVWDEAIMADIVKQTNNYAWQVIAQLSESEKRFPSYINEWSDTTVAEMYVYFSMLIHMSLCYRSRVRDYWTTNLLEMPGFRKIMPRNRFLVITKFLHFCDNNDHNDHTLSSYDQKIFKIRPVLDYCNSKFASLYVPTEHLSLDESLLLWKGRLSWVQCIRTKAARFGIKSYELCEAKTGYLLRCLLYAGKHSTVSEEAIHGFDSCAAKIVLELMDGFLDVGHTLVMDNWYNQLPLTRYLKGRRTDVLGTLNPSRVHVPEDIKRASEMGMVRGQQLARHCGDITIIAWQDVKLVTAVSTYHTDQQLPARRAGENVLKPAAILEYNKNMGGVDSKDQKLSMFLMERKRCKKWYMKVFKRLLNTSLMNTFIIYSRNTIAGSNLTHRDFRTNVAYGLIKRFHQSRSILPPLPAPIPPGFQAPSDKDMRRLLSSAKHFVEHTEMTPGKNKRKQLRCVRCTVAGRRTNVTIRCSFCQVPLCVGACWADYHTLKSLK